MTTISVEKDLHFELKEPNSTLGLYGMSDWHEWIEKTPKEREREREQFFHIQSSKKRRNISNSLNAFSREELNIHIFNKSYFSWTEICFWHDMKSHHNDATQVLSRWWWCWSSSCMSHTISIDVMWVPSRNNILIYSCTILPPKSNLSQEKYRLTGNDDHQRCYHLHAKQSSGHKLSFGGFSIISPECWWSPPKRSSAWWLGGMFRIFRNSSNISANIRCMANSMQH